MGIITTIRELIGIDVKPSKFAQEHYNRFEEAVKVSDVQAYVYNDNGYKGAVLVPKGEDLHQVTINNLVSFYRLNRQQRNQLQKTKEYRLYEHNNKGNR